MAHSISFVGLWSAALVLLLPFASARHVSGDFKLSGSHTEHLLAKFALSSYAEGWMDLSLTSSEMYENELSLKLHFFYRYRLDQVEKAPTM